MGRNKALLKYTAGKSQLERSVELLAEFCQKVFVSSSHEVASAAKEYCKYEVIYDDRKQAGPVGGILSAMKMHPNVAFLVIAVDLPALTERVLDRLIKNRQPSSYATCYRSFNSDLLEPLCAIYEPQACAALQSMFEMGMTCPRKMLQLLNVCALDQLDARDFLQNVNTAKEYEDFLSEWEPSSI